VPPGNQGQDAELRCTGAPHNERIEKADRGDRFSQAFDVLRIDIPFAERDTNVLDSHGAESGRHLSWVSHSERVSVDNKKPPNGGPRTKKPADRRASQHIEGSFH
jgi:hypothetical protein